MRTRRRGFVPLLLRFLCLPALLLCGGLTVAWAQEKISVPSRDGTALDAYLFRPHTTGPAPAMVFAHGCGGLLNSAGRINTRETDWARHLNAAGYVVLMVDSFTTRGVRNMCSPSSFQGAVYRARSQDLYEALAYLQAQPYVAPSRVGVMGWSLGGGAVLNALRTDSSARPAGLAPDRDFRAAVAFYPASCSAERQRGSWSSRIPLLVLLGDGDVWTPLAPCRSLIEAAAAQGNAVTLKVYAGAYHDFDWPNRPYKELTEYRTAAGVVPIIATDPAARADASSRVPAFLAKYLK